MNFDAVKTFTTEKHCTKIVFIYFGVAPTDDDVDWRPHTASHLRHRGQKQQGNAEPLYSWEFTADNPLTAEFNSRILPTNSFFLEPTL